MVDVGGGLGAPSMILAKTFLELRIIVQDRLAVAQQAEEVGDSVSYTGLHALDESLISALGKDI